MIISALQMAAMLESNRQRYVQNYRSLMRCEFPEFWTRFDDAQIEQILMDQCAYAGRHGLQSGRAAYLIFTLRLRLGRDFPDGEAFGWARAILERRGCNESEMLDALETRVWGAAA
jgi:hypothetical protein